LSTGVCVCVTGQYGGVSKPMPDYHVKVASFNDTVSCVTWSVGRSYR